MDKYLNFNHQTSICPTPPPPFRTQKLSTVLHKHHSITSQSNRTETFIPQKKAIMSITNSTMSRILTPYSTYCIASGEVVWKVEDMGAVEIGIRKVAGEMRIRKDVMRRLFRGYRK
jgi:hypothetical protein